MKWFSSRYSRAQVTHMESSHVFCGVTSLYTIFHDDTCMLPKESSNVWRSEFMSSLNENVIRLLVKLVCAFKSLPWFDEVSAFAWKSPRCLRRRRRCQNPADPPEYPAFRFSKGTLASSPRLGPPRFLSGINWSWAERGNLFVNPLKILGALN